MTKTSKIFLVNYDWKDLQRTDPIEFWAKLERDKFCPDVNEFFFFSWSTVSYRILEGRLKTAHVATRIYPLKPLLDIRAIFSISYAAYKYGIRPDAWVTYDFGMLPALWIAKMLFGGKIIAYVIHQPRLYSKTRRFGFVKYIYSWLVEKLWHRLADNFMTLNLIMKEYLKSIGIKEEKISIYYINTIDRDIHFLEKAKKGTIRPTYGIPPQSKIMISAGRLESEKNHSTLLRLFAGLGESYVLIILGKGSLEARLRNEALNLGISDRVIFSGHVDRQKIWDYYADADVFCLLSKAEALGLVFWEAILMGVPVIGSEADGIKETIGFDGERGRIWREEEGPNGFKEKVEFCIKVGPEREEMMKRATEFVNDRRQNRLTINDVIHEIEN